MKKKIFGLFSILLMLVLCIQVLALPVSAAGQPAVQVPVEIRLSGTLPEVADKFLVRLAPNAPSNPMPEGSANGEYILTIEGAGAASFPTITYNRVGVYGYTIAQKPDTTGRCDYDRRVYELTVFVTNAEDGSGLEATAVLHITGEDEKKPDVEFVNVYPTVETQPPETTAPPDDGEDDPKTGDESNFPLYVTLAAGSVMVLCALFLTRKREEESM